MTRPLVAKAKWLRAYRRLSDRDQRFVDAAVMRFQQYLNSGQASPGLGMTHLGGRVYEFRIGLALRSLYVVEQERIMLLFLGDHDEVQRFLKHQ